MSKPPSRGEWWTAWLVVALPLMGLAAWLGTHALRGSAMATVGVVLVAVLLIPVARVAAIGPPD
jgi:hypothetical protein